VSRWGSRRTLLNLYGPTEATVWSTAAGPLAADDPVSIGAPIDGTSVLVLDASLRPVPVGVVGELYLTGSGLARGYLGRPGLTAERFVANPFGDPAVRMYRTGDLVRWNTSHALEFVGRVDDQVKIRGFRVELGEIDAVLASAPGVETAVTVARSAAGAPVLASYVQGAGVDSAAVRAFIAERLPRFMVPASVTVLDELPLTHSGKVDRAALLETVSPAGESREPRTPVEQVVADAVAEVLGVPAVGADTDFFALGGNSLSATQVVSRLSAVAGVRIGVLDLFENPTVAGLAALIADGGLSGPGSPRPALLASAVEGRPPLGSEQQRLWLINQMDPAADPYVIAFSVDLDGHLEVDAFRSALVDVFDRHAPLRTVLPLVDDAPVQVITNASVDLTPVQVEPDSVDPAVAAVAGGGFDLVTETPIRLRLFRIAPDRHVLAVAVHHIAVDGLSFVPLARDLTAAYTARMTGQAPAWAPLPVQYTDYAMWQRTVLGDPADPTSLAARGLSFWASELDGMDATLLPTDRPRVMPDAQAEQVDFEISAELHRAIEAVAQQLNATTFMVLHAALAVLLRTLTGSADTAIGTSVSGRTDPAVDDLVGMFVGTVVLRARVDAGSTFAELLASVRRGDVRAFTHTEVPFDRVVEAVAPERSGDHHPLFQVMLAYQNFSPTELALPGLTARARAMGSNARGFDLDIDVEEMGSGNGLSGSITYPTALFDRQTIERWADLLQHILSSVAADAAVVVGDLDLMAPADRAALVPASGPAAMPARTLPDLLDAGLSSGGVALRYEGVDVTYRDLDRRANRLARQLIDRGIGPEDLVAVMAPRSIESVVAMWAVARAGAAFVPIDPGYPAERIAHMLADSAVRVALAAEAAVVPGGIAWIGTAELSGDGAPITDRDRVRPLRVDHPAYVIYTSGSTGTPKGVTVTHRGLAAMVAANAHSRQLDENSRVMHFASPSFDVSVGELLLAFTSGATLVIAPASMYGGDELTELFRRERVTHFLTTPTVPALMNPEGLDDLRVLEVCGEACPPELAARWAPGRTMINSYGPTETTVVCTSAEPLRPGVHITLGRPYAGTEAVVLDERLRPVPVGVVGELYLSGECLARGYHGKAGLTAGRFVAGTAAAAGARMYRTGDMVRWTASHELEFAGRTDDQVKIRGFRVELGEIDAVLAQFPGVGTAVTVTRTSASGESVLASYVHGTDVDSATVLAFAAKRLPRYLVPASVTVLDEVPLTRSGKLDKAALPEPAAAAASSRAPRGVLEELVAGVVADVLGVPSVDVHADFFALGGSSLTATRLASRLGAASGRRVAVREVFESPTVALLAARMSDEPGSRPPLVRSSDEGPAPLALAQQRLWLLDRINPRSADYLVPFAVDLDGDVDVDALAAAVRDVVTRHEPLRTVFPDTDSGPVQAVHAAQLDLTPETTGAEGVDAAIGALAGRGFDLTGEVPVRIRIFERAPGSYTVAVVVHHIVMDGLSFAPLIRDLVTAYESRRAGHAPAWADLAVRYSDYARWEREVQSASAQQHLEFWIAELDGLPELLPLPTDRPRASPGQLTAGQVPFRMDAELHLAVEDLARTHKSTTFMVVHAALAVALSVVSGSNDLSVGTPVSGRTDPALDDLVGMFVGTVVLRSRVDPRATFADFLASVRAADLAAFAHADVPFDQVVDAVGHDRAGGHTPLFQVMLAYENFTHGEAAFEGVTVRNRDVASTVSRFDLEVTIRELHGEGRRASGLDGEIRYPVELFDDATIARWAGLLQRILRAATADPLVVVGEIDVIDAAERAALVPLAGPAAVEPVTLPNLLRGDLEGVALRFEGSDTTYRQLDARANRLARRLIGLGVGPEDRVALMLPRSV
ncbi:amino acid adenylation domain-containing protein, partial [Rhodococcus sp. WS4]